MREARLCYQSPAVCRIGRGEDCPRDQAESFGIGQSSLLLQEVHQRAIGGRRSPCVESHMSKSAAIWLGLGLMQNRGFAHVYTLRLHPLPASP